MSRILSVAVLALLLSACGARHYRLQVEGRSDLLTPPKRSGEPVSSREAYQRAYGPYVSNGYIDLREGMHLQVVAPAMPAGQEISTNVVSRVQESPSSITLTLESNVKGWETAYYVVERSSTGGALSLRFLSGESSIEGETKPMASADRAHIALPNRFSMLRLVFRQGESAADRDAGLIAASTSQALDDALTHLEQSCKGPPSEGFACVPITNGIGINAVVGVSANRQMHYFPLGTALSGLLRTADDIPVGSVPPNLKVRRRFRSRLATIRYDPAAVLGLVLMDGDSVEWSPAGR